MSDTGREKYSESTLKLAERYGIDPARLDAMLGKPKDDIAHGTPAVEPTREWIDERRIHQPNVEVPAQKPTPVIAKDPVKIVDPVINPAAAATPIRKVKDVRVEGSPLASGPRSTPPRNEKTYTYQKESSSPLTWIIGLIILGALAILFFMARGCNQEPRQQTPPPTATIDTVVVADTITTKDTVAVPLPAATEEPKSAPAPKPAVRKTPARKAASSAASSARNVALSTTSSFAAQEKLAELKADGNTRAKIQRVTKNGVTVYQVRTK
jgi:hypothetical protein